MPIIQWNEVSGIPGGPGALYCGVTVLLTSLVLGAWAIWMRSGGRIKFSKAPTATI